MAYTDWNGLAMNHIQAGTEVLPVHILVGVGNFNDHLPIGVGDYTNHAWLPDGKLAHITGITYTEDGEERYELTISDWE